MKRWTRPNGNRIQTLPEKYRGGRCYYAELDHNGFWVDSYEHLPNDAVAQETVS
jgi:hypothetical protein